MRNIKLLIEYDGTQYAGWQKQKNAIAIQDVIEKALYKLTGEETDVVGSSRTDSGVHAVGYVANFKTQSNIPSDKFCDAINTKLPKSIVILKSQEIDIEFHSRYDCKGKTYCYTIINRKMPSAITRNYSHHVSYALNIEKMQEACEYFIGTKDFAALKNLGSSVKTTTRTITDIRIEVEKDIVKVYCTADGFLYNMMRIIVGILIQVGTGKFKPEDVKRIIASKERKMAGTAVPASGLCLMEVFY